MPILLTLRDGEQFTRFCNGTIWHPSNGPGPGIISLPNLLVVVVNLHPDLPVQLTTCSARMGADNPGDLGWLRSNENKEPRDRYMESVTTHIIKSLQLSSGQNPYDIPLYWLVNRDSYNDLL